MRTVQDFDPYGGDPWKAGKGSRDTTVQGRGGPTGLDAVYGAAAADQGFGAALGLFTGGLSEGIQGLGKMDWGQVGNAIGGDLTTMFGGDQAGQDAWGRAWSGYGGVGGIQQSLGSIGKGLMSILSGPIGMAQSFGADWAKAWNATDPSQLQSGPAGSPYTKPGRWEEMNQQKAAARGDAYNSQLQNQANAAPSQGSAPAMRGAASSWSDAFNQGGGRGIPDFSSLMGQGQGGNPAYNFFMYR